MMWTRLSSGLCLAVCLTTGFASADQSASGMGSPFAGAVTEESVPAPDGSGEPFLAVGRMGQVHLSWLEPRPDGGHRFRVSSLMATTWSDPITIAEGDDLLANWADVPTLHVAADTIAASWPARGPGRGYGIRVRTSPDGGRTWTPSVTPHRDETASDHGFVSFFELPGAGANLGLVWLDGRETGRREDGSRGSMALRATTLSGGSPGDETVVDPRVCDCCPTAAARIDGGVIVVYRDRSPEEVRDIASVRYLNGRWTDPVTVHADGWQIDACPVNGPVVAASGRSVAVAWYTVAGGTPSANVAFSSDGGETFSAARPIDAGVSYGRMGIAMLDADRVLVSSIERADDGTFIVVREVRRNGRLSDVVRVAPTSSDRRSGMPRMVVSGRRVLFAWTEVDEAGGSRVKVASARLK